ncbi:PREDICTED: ensconsin-like [Brassica oleracea var. oleracea]|uniref:ensconsin-like n=1 Tax=Brassica oleracea var. oleracea TaxID=109376 RepID=UPI0006A708FB|nr:PREDICTED: ensconsin-like [Brassica oleracea var. oleracea]
MGEANSALPTPDMREATPTFIAGFLSFKERLSSRSAGKEGGRIQPEAPAILSSPAMSTSAGGNKSHGDAMPLVELAMVPVQVPEVSAQPSGSSTTPVPAPKEEKAMELMPPPLDRKEIVLGLPASSAAPLTKIRKRTGAATETVKKRRCTAGAEGEPSGPLPQYRAKIERSTRGLAKSREALKQAEATLKSTEAARAAELSQLEVWVSDLERDLVKSASALFKLKKEKKSKASEVRRLQREIQNREESKTVVSSDDFHARLTRMAVLLLSRKEELKASNGDFDSVLSQLQFECTLTPCSGETEGHCPVAEEGGDVASGRGNDEVAEGGNGYEVEDEGSAPRSA